MNPPSLERNCTGGAFTLVELLAVLGIVTLLAVLIFPTVQGIRKKGASVGCTANLRTLHLAHRMWEQENNGKPPPPFYTTHEKHQDYHEGHSGPGIRLLRRYYREGPDFVWAGSKYIQEKVELCPAVRFEPKLSGSKNNPQNGPDYVIYSVVEQNYGTYFLKPAQRPLIWDGFGGDWRPENPEVPLRHENGINCVFLDGHVEKIAADDPRLYHRWWMSAVINPEPNPDRLGVGTPMGVTERPEN